MTILESVNRQNSIWVLVGILFALGSIAIQYQVKIEMVQIGHVAPGQLGDLRKGSEAPDFSSTDLQGRQVVLSEFRNRTVVLDFWATWCGPCLMWMPKLQEIHDEFEGREVEFLAVNLGEDSQRIRRFIGRKEYTFRVVEDPDQAIGNRFGVSAIPVLVVVRANGRIEWIHVGASPDKADHLRVLLERLTRESQSLGAVAI